MAEVAKPAKKRLKLSDDDHTESIENQYPVVMFKRSVEQSTTEIRTKRLNKFESKKTNFTANFDLGSSLEEEKFAERATPFRDDSLFPNFIHGLLNDDAHQCGRNNLPEESYSSAELSKFDQI